MASHRLARLDFPGKTPEVLEALHKLHVDSVEDFLCTSEKVLVEKAQLPKELVGAIMSRIISLYAPQPMIAFEMLEAEARSLTQLPFGTPALDTLLRGGLRIGEVTEFVGGSATGKTQLCFMLAVTTAIAQFTNASQPSTDDQPTVLWIDTSKSFSPERLSKLLAVRRIVRDTAQRILSSIRCLHAFDALSLYAILDSLSNQLTIPTRLRLVIIDCFGAVMSPVVGGSQSFGHSLMIQTSRLIKTLAIDTGIAVVVTNYTTGRAIDDNAPVGGSEATSRARSRGTSVKNKPALGAAWAHEPHAQIYLSFPPSSTAISAAASAGVDAASIRCAMLTHSGHAPSGHQALFAISESGLLDVGMSTAWTAPTDGSTADAYVFDEIAVEQT